MHLRKCGLLALGVIAASADAFRDTSPFFFFSTNEFETTSEQIKSATSILDGVTNDLLTCPSDFYIIATQPGVHVLDYTTRRSAPRLRERVLKKDDAVKSSFTVSETVGQFDIEYLQSMLESKCGAKTVTVDGASEMFPSSYEGRPQLIKVEFPNLPIDSSRSSQLADNDGFLASIIDLLPSQDYTVLYTTTPRGPEPIANADQFQSHYEVEFDHIQEPMKSHSKRDSDSDDDDDDDNDDDNDERRNVGLFEKYQFLSPGLFMGLIVGSILISLLYVGLSALASLKVSYAAFEKQNGPAATKKQQ